MHTSRWVALVLLVLTAGTRPALAQVDATGDWFGVLASQIGEMHLILTIDRDAAGELIGTLESPDQGSGQVPVNRIAVVEGHLTFAVDQAGVSYQGDWIEANQQWTGTFTQGGTMPLSFRRGLPPARPIVAGLDGVWEGVVTRSGADLRLILRVATGARGTVATLDSPDLGARGLPVAGFARQERKVEFSVPASGARFDGALSDNETRLLGTWTLPGQPNVQLELSRGQ